MVTTGAGDIAAIAGMPAAGQQATGNDDSVFAQLLGDAAATVPAAAAAVDKVAGERPVNAPVTTDTASATPAADLLALCGLVVTLPTTTTSAATSTAPMPTEPAATEPSAQRIATDPSTLAAMVTPAPLTAQVPPLVAQHSSSGDSPVIARAADLQWLQSGLRSEAGRAAPMKPAAVKADGITTPDAAAPTVPVLPQTTLTTPMTEQVDQQLTGSSAVVPAQPVPQAAQTAVLSITQPASSPAPVAMAAVASRPTLPTASDAQAVSADAAVLPPKVTDIPALLTSEQSSEVQGLLAQLTPVMNVATAQLRDSDIEPRDMTMSDAQSIVGTVTTSLQPAGTQLAQDTSLQEVSPRHHLQAQVGTHQWATELGNRLTMLATRDTQSATLYMTPADLGPVQVRIDLNQDQASVWFTAEHAETRSALEQSLPKLRELFSAQGMSLTDAGVFGDRSRQQQAESSFTATRFHNLQYEDSETLADTATVRTISLGLLDAYA